MANVVLRVSALVIAAFALALVYLRLPESAARGDRVLCERCNVVLISFDTVRADHLGAYGYGRDTSPNVDALAGKSLVFERAISQAPWTLPSHGSMLSGLYGSRLGVLNYPANRTLPDQNVVLPEVFRAAGYKTGGFAGGGFVSDHYGFDRGFDTYSSSGRRFEHNLDATIEWLDRNKDEPFFLFFHGYDAHRPYYSKALDKKVMDLPTDGATEQPKYCLRDDRDRPSDAKLEMILRYYDAAIHHGDRGIGVLLDALERLGLMEDTVILLTSDHGEEFFEHGNCDHVRFVYNESVHVPYILHVPHLTPGGRRIDGLMPASISVARTLLDLVGIDHAMPGVTLLPMIAGKQKYFPVVYSEASSQPGILGSRGRVLAMTKPDLKLISYTDEGTDEAYDLTTDPGEKEPLAERNVAYLMRQTLRSWSDSLRALPRPKSRPDPDAEAAYHEDSTGASGDDDGEESQKAAPDESKARGAGKPDGAAVLPGGTAPADAGGKPGAKPSGKRKGRAKKAGKGDSKMPKELEESLRSLGYLE